MHFSIGFVAESTPRIKIASVCASIKNIVNVTAVFARDLVSCKRRIGNMSCGCGGCISRGFICAPRGDDLKVLVSVMSPSGQEYDISGATEIVFIVATGEWVGGNIYPGGTVDFEKKLSDGDIQLAGTDYQFLVNIAGSDTADFDTAQRYYEIRITSAAAENSTISSGVFFAENTMIKDL